MISEMLRITITPQAVQKTEIEHSEGQWLMYVQQARFYPKCCILPTQCVCYIILIRRDN